MKKGNILKQMISVALICCMFASDLFVEVASVNTGIRGITRIADEQFTLEGAFWNESGYNEYIAENENTLGIDFNIRNNSTTSELLQPYFVLYENEKMIAAQMLSSQTVGIGDEVSYSESINVNGNNIENYTAKIFNWASENMKPLCESINVYGHRSDFYGDNVTAATMIQDFDKDVNGSINTVSDIDYLKITPTTSGMYSMKIFSTTNILGTLYNSSGVALVSDSNSVDYTLTANELYYIKLYNPDNVGDYVLTIDEIQSIEATKFNIYEFDDDVNVYKKSILKMCDDLYYDLYNPNKTLSKQICSEYEGIFNDDVKLHALPDFLAEHPKNISNFDEILNDYYQTKYDEFQELKQRYISLIDKYTETNSVMSIAIPENEIETPIVGKFAALGSERNNIETSIIKPGVQIQQIGVTPSLAIVNTTETSITYNAIFPVSGRWGNAIYLLDFNTDNGLTTWENVYGTNEYRTNGQYTISGLEPGGIYILQMTWSTDGVWMGYENSMFRYVQLPDYTEENLSLYSGGRVSARLEPADKALASSVDFDEWLDRMDDVYCAYKELTGYTPFNSQKIEMESTRENLNEHFSVIDGENYYWVVYGFYDGTRVFKYGRPYYKGLMKRLQYDDWGWLPIHEMSHVFDDAKWTFDEESLAQFKAYYIMEQLNAKIYDCNENEDVMWYVGEEYHDYLKYNRFKQSYVNSFEKGEYASEGFAAILIDIQKEIGWEPFKKTFRYFSSLSSLQINGGNGGKLKLFLTKLKDYSGKDVIAMISGHDVSIIEDWYDITLEYVEPIYPSISGGGTSGGSIETIEGYVNYSVFEFKPNESANYYIYTSPYGGSGVSNDTYIEVYDNASLSGMPLASNDDYDGGRFSKVDVAMTEGIIYYIKIRHYNNGQLHAEINITQNIPVVELSLDDYEDVSVAFGEYALYSFTPTRSITHVFEVGNYNDGTLMYDTYIKLYGNESMTQRIGYHDEKIIVNLTAGHTYYLQFSGFLMVNARGRISVREGQTIEFSKKTDSSFIYVNSPEYITRFDIVDDISHIQPVLDKTIEQPYVKLSEFENVTGDNTFYETHTAWWGALVNVGNETYNYDPLQQFYLDIDMYNPTASPITVSIENLAYGVNYSVLQQYYNGGYDYEITIEPYSHVPIFSYLGAPLLCEEKSATEWARIPVILFDFTVHSGNITVSTIAAYNPQNLYLRYGTKNVVDATGAALESGEVIYAVDGNGNVAWGEIYDPRRNETDLYAKMKGIALNESAWIDANIEIAIDDSTELGTNIPIYLKDSYYNYGISNPKWSWKSSINPLNDKWDSVLMALPNGLHNFKYHYDDTDRQWYFDFWHRDLRYMDINGSSTSVNNEVPYEIRNNAKLDMAAGQKEHFGVEEAPDEYSMSIGEWGATYHYTVTVNNTTDDDRVVYVNTWSAENMIFGLKTEGSSSYATTYYSKIYNTPNEPTNTAIVNVPKNSITTFEFVTLLGGGLGGLNHAIVVE